LGDCISACIGLLAGDPRDFNEEYQLLALGIAPNESAENHR